jgi:hypothetical protein
MIPWSAADRRWRDALLAAVIPRIDPEGLPGLEDLDPGRFFGELDRAAPPLLRFGFRAAVWVLTFSPIFLLGKPRRFGALPPSDRDLLLGRAASSRLYLLRQLVLALKLVACFAYFQDPTLRARFWTAEDLAGNRIAP